MVSGRTPNQVLREAPSGLRERKKQRTRATLVQAAVALCLKQGYEQTTVEQIAIEADVSPRTFSRYFATKDAVFLTLIEDYVELVYRELQTIPDDIGPLEALRLAHVRVLERVVKRPLGELPNDAIVLMLKIINASEALRKAAFEYKHVPTELLVAERMGVAPDDRRARLVGIVFSSVIVTACGDLVADTEDVTLGAGVMIDRLNDAFAILAAVAADIDPPGARPAVSRVFEAVNG